MTSLARIPCTIVTGFLGAGKTTLIRHVLANANGRRLAVIVNEFGDVGIDGEILKGCGDAACPEQNIVELANGCLCCTVADEFVPALDLILAMEPKVEHIVIETSGLALPKPLVQAFHWPSIKNRVTVDGVVAVVDGAALAAGRVADDMAALAAPALGRRARSTMTIRSRRCSRIRSPAPTWWCSTNATCSIRAAWRRRQPRSAGALSRAVKVVKAFGRQGRRAPALLGLNIGTESRHRNRKTHHDDELDHDHDDFESFVVPLPRDRPIPTRCRSWSSATAEAAGVLRIKGFAAVRGKPMRLLVQAVGPRVTTQYDRAWTPSEQRGTQLVVIGLKGLDRDKIARMLNG